MGDRNGDKSGGKNMLDKINSHQNNRYKMFNDEAKAATGWGGFEYAGDGKEQIEWLKKYSNAYELIQKMNRDEREAFLGWARGDFMDGSMYKDWNQLPHYAQEQIKVYDKYLDKATVKRGLIVTRDTTAELLFGKGIKTGTIDEFRAMQGKNVFSKSAISTGAAKTGLSIGAKDKEVRFRIKIPAGSKGAGMWIADSRIHGWGVDQREFMINRESWFKVGKTVYDKKSGKYIVTLTWVGHEKHDYGKKK